MALPEVIRAVTATPAKVLGLAGRIGTLSPGATGDVAVFERQHGDLELEDNDGGRLTGPERLTPVLTIKDGEVWWRGLPSPPSWPSAPRG
jgi:predicted amidohydrolase